MSSISLPEVSCTEPSVSPQRALRHRVRNITSEPGLHVVWRERFRAFAAEVPRSPLATAELCRALSKQQWSFCRTPPPPPVQYNTLSLVLMPCAFADGGSNYRGALYDGTRVLNAQHASATPSFARAAVMRYDTVAVGLTPYGHLTDSHFYASTAAWILQLLAIVPAHVPLLVSSNVRLRSLYDAIGLPSHRLITLPSKGAVYASRLLSLVTTP